MAATSTTHLFQTRMFFPPTTIAPLTSPFSTFLGPHQRLLSKGCRRIGQRRRCRHSMFVNAKLLLKDGTLSVNGKDALKGVPENVVVTPFTGSSAFIGATCADASSRLVFKLGVIQDVRLLCLYRFKIWWMIPRVGNSGRDIPIETQMLLMEAREGNSQSSKEHNSYFIFLPVLDGEFRSSLQGNSSNELELCVESGDPEVVTSQFLNAVFMNYGGHPFDLVKESMNLSEGGTPAKFLIIDDGWQDTVNEFQKDGEPFIEGSQFGGRLISIKENSKFRAVGDVTESGAPVSLKDFVSEIKSSFGLKYVYVWHALLGYWGGLDPNASGTKKYDPKLRYPVQSPGNLANTRDLSIDAMEKYGIGVMDPAKISEFYDDLHSYLVSQNIDGVKVDVQNILETISSGLGGRVLLTRRFQQELEKSISTNFQDNSIICCMAHNTDSTYHSKQSAITRASDDYYPKNPTTQSLHIAAIAFNSIFFGEIVVPDWDMFYSLHDAAEFHAVARAVGGCGVYVSDKPGQHDFNVLKKLVLPDGSVLRARYPGRPSRDCLFIDPVMDKKSLLKIWNLNKCGGVVGIFNCQGTGSWPGLESNAEEDITFELSGKVSPSDIEYFEEVSTGPWTQDCAVFRFNTGSLTRLSKEESFDITLKVLQCEVFTVSPIMVYNQTIQFAPIGLTNMYNSGGAVEAVDSSDSSGSKIHITGRGGGDFGAYSNLKPKSCYVNSEDLEFQFREEDNFFGVTIRAKTSSWEITICY
ncbi:putative galactinol--sucrose galactosyltransferase 2 [Glycine max]|nr:putative galactinol--sucrose galactosyltransferase 2 [Glycine max]